MRGWRLAAALIVVLALAGATIAHLAGRPDAAADRPVLRVGDVRGGMRVLMSAAGVLDDLPYEVTWSTVPASAVLAEALSADALDIGSMATAPFAFAYSNGGALRAVQALQLRTDLPGSGRGSAILVNAHSPLKTVADLRGRRLALIKGSGGHDTALRLFERAGVDPADVDFVYLSNADAKAALASGAVDAWSTFGTYVGIAVSEGGARVLADIHGLPNGQTILQITTTSALRDRQPLLRDFLRRYLAARDWAARNPQALAEAIARDTGISPAAAAYGASAVTDSGAVTIDAGLIAAQRETVARFRKAGVIGAPPGDFASGFDGRFNDLVTPPVLHSEKDKRP